MRKQKSNLQEDIDRNYTWSQVKTVLKLYGLREKPFTEYMNGQTCPMVEVDGKREIGVYGWDLFRYIDHKKKGTPLIWD